MSKHVWIFDSVEDRKDFLIQAGDWSETLTEDTEKLWSHRDVGWKGHIVQHLSWGRTLAIGPALVLSVCILKTSKDDNFTSSRFSRANSQCKCHLFVCLFIFFPSNIHPESPKPLFRVAFCCSMLCYLLLREEFNSIFFITAIESQQLLLEPSVASS